MDIKMMECYREVDQRHTSRGMVEEDDMLLLGQSKTCVWKWKAGARVCYRFAAIEDMRSA
jgi:hypothetical protein